MLYNMATSFTPSQHYKGEMLESMGSVSGGQLISGYKAMLCVGEKLDENSISDPSGKSLKTSQYSIKFSFHFSNSFKQVSSMDIFSQLHNKVNAIKAIIMYIYS